MAFFAERYNSSKLPDTELPNGNISNELSFMLSGWEADSTPTLPSWTNLMIFLTIRAAGLQEHEKLGSLYKKWDTTLDFMEQWGK